MDIVLKPKKQPREGLDADVINPDIFAGRSIAEIEALEIFNGNRRVKLTEFFDVSGSTSSSSEDIRIIIDGDVSRTKRIGQGMKAGEILIKGSIDMYVGAEMKGGRIIVEGNADSFAGQQLAGGELIIKGNAGNCIGSSYRGDWRGMTGGTITVWGNAGSENAEFMRGGNLHIKGDCGPFVGLHMKKGMIVIEGNASGRVGAQMVGGKIVVMKKAGPLLPGFKFEKEEKDIKIDGSEFKGKFLKYTGDYAERNAKGLLYLNEKLNRASI